jgi:hypothetical protein
MKCRAWIEGIGALVVTASVSVAIACSASRSADSNDSNIIGGFDAASAKLNAIGTVGLVVNGALAPLCTATLIGPHTVVTAKHCVLDLERATPADGGAASPPPAPGEHKLFLDEGSMAFAIGPNTALPVRMVPIATAAVAALDEGGAIGIGADVGVYTLAEDVTDVEPMLVASEPVNTSMIGQTLTVVGYGFQDLQKQKFGTRRAGAATVRAVQGEALEAAFGTAQAFFDAVAKVEGEAFVEANKAHFQELYDKPLLADYELYAGMAAGDAQTCSGDSGGPLLATLSDGRIEVVAVASAVMTGTDTPCLFGSWYAMFGPKVHELITAALDDPCNGLGTAGRCEGTKASRCSAPDEGPRRVVALDCATLHQVCGVQGGVAACVDGVDAGGVTTPDAGVPGDDSGLSASGDDAGSDT